jgi:hypothetical protein
MQVQCPKCPVTITFSLATAIFTILAFPHIFQYSGNRLKPIAIEKLYHTLVTGS